MIGPIFLLYAMDKTLIFAHKTMEFKRKLKPKFKSKDPRICLILEFLAFKIQSFCKSNSWTAFIIIKLVF